MTGSGGVMQQKKRPYYRGARGRFALKPKEENALASVKQDPIPVKQEQIPAGEDTSKQEQIPTGQDTSVEVVQPPPAPVVVLDTPSASASSDLANQPGGEVRQM